MTVKLVYSREHVCHNLPMIWQPAGHHFYCAVCHRKEAPNEYIGPKPLTDAQLTKQIVDSIKPWK